MNIDENVANNSQPTDNIGAIIGEGNCTLLQVQMAVRNGQSRPGKRPIKNVSPADKVGAIDRVHDGESKASVARDIGIPESTLRGWCKSEHKIRSQCNNVSTEMITRHCPINVGNGRSMLANGRQSVGSWDSSNNRHSPDTSSDDDASVAKKAKIECTNRQNNSQTIRPGPSISSADNYISHGIDPNYAALIASSMANSMTAMSLHEQHQMYALLTTLREAILQRNNSTAPVEDGLHRTKINDIMFPTIANSSALINNTTTNIKGIDNVHGTMKNMIGNTLNCTIDNGNIAVASNQSTTSLSTRKLTNVTAAAEAPAIPAPVSPRENNARLRQVDDTTKDDENIKGDAFWTWFVQQILNIQRFRGHNSEDVNNMLNLRKSWYWQYAKWSKFLAKNQCTAESYNALNYLDLLFNNNNFGNPVSDGTSENRSRSHSVSSEGSDSREEREDSLITATTTERAMLTTSPVIEPMLSSEVMEALQVAKSSPHNSDIEKAIEYSTWLQEWLNNCSIPLFTRRQVLEHKYILDALKWFKNSQSTTQEKVAPGSCTTSAGRHDEGRQL